MATSYRGRRAAVLENDRLRVTVLHEGGHIAEIYDKTAGVNPLWTPPWPTIEPSMFDPADAAIYGSGGDARLLSGIMGHNLCLDIFGPPSDEEARAGLTPHGEGSMAPYDLTVAGEALTARARFPIAGLEFQRRVVLRQSALRDPGDRDERVRPRSRDRLDSACDTGTAISRMRNDAVSRVGHAIESLRNRFWCG